MNFGKLGQPRITIDIDTIEGNYNVDFEHCSLPVAYAIMRNIVERIESGELFNGEVEIEDTNGNTISEDDAKQVVRELKEQLDSCPNSSGEGRVVKVVTEHSCRSKSD